MKTIRLTVFATLALTVLGVVASFLVPVPRDNVPLEFYSNLTLSVATVILYIGSSFVIAMGFGAFTNKLRRPYTIIFIGLSLWGLAYLQLPVLAATGKLDSAIFSSFTVLPFIASAMLTFAGTRALAKNFNVTSIAMRWWFAFVIIIAASVALGVLPHAPSQTPEIEYDLVNALNIWAIVFFGLGAYHALLIKRRASVAFTNALAWLFLSMFITSVLAGGGTTLVVLFFGDGAAQIILLLALMPSCISAALFLRSAYSFNQIVESADVEGQSVARDFFGRPLKPRTRTQTSSVDIVTYAANLASQPKEIDDIMDDVRLVTSHMHQGEPVSREDDERLLQVYLKIEQYLLTKESVRVFTKDSLRQDIAQKLRLTAGATSTFWPKLS